MPNVYLQKDLGMIGDLLHSYRDELKKEFLESTKEFLSENYFTQSTYEQKIKNVKHTIKNKISYSKSPNENYYGYVKKILNRLIEKQKIDKKESKRILTNIKFSYSIKEIEKAEIVVEAKNRWDLHYLSLIHI